MAPIFLACFFACVPLPLHGAPASTIPRSGLFFPKEFRAWEHAWEDCPQGRASGGDVNSLYVLFFFKVSQMEEVTGSMLDAAKSGDSNKLQVSRDVVLAALSQPLHACMRGIGERGHE